MSDLKLQQLASTSHHTDQAAPAPLPSAAVAAAATAAAVLDSSSSTTTTTTTTSINNDITNTNDNTTTTTVSDLDNQQRAFSCDMCDKVFTRKHNLETHKLVHSQNKPYTCTICKSGFKRSHDLKRHKRMHTGEKPHMCHKCDRSFARADALLRHTKHGCSSTTTATTPSSSTNTKSLTHEQLQQQPSSHDLSRLEPHLQSTDKRLSFETVQWKASPIAHHHQPIEKYINNRSSISNPSFQSSTFDISNPQSNTRSTSIGENNTGTTPTTTTTTPTPNHHPQQQNYYNNLHESSITKISLLEHKVQQLEKHIDNDQFRIRNLENRLMRLESSNLRN